jgi:hypothetical protein
MEGLSRIMEFETKRNYKISIIDSSYYGWTISNSGFQRKWRVHFFSVDAPSIWAWNHGEIVTQYFIGRIEDTSQPDSQYDEIWRGSEKYLKSVWKKKVLKWAKDHPGRGW